MIKTYSELITIPTFEKRFEYLKCTNIIGNETFGYDRYLNQSLYRSYEWRKFRREIILRDCGCDLGCPGYEIYNRIIIHHINPLTVDDIKNKSRNIFDPENVICTSHNTHQAIHYSDKNILLTEVTERTQNDTCLWKHISKEVTDHE